jgi:hypothetical protein
MHGTSLPKKEKKYHEFKLPAEQTTQKKQGRSIGSVGHSKRIRLFVLQTLFLEQRGNMSIRLVQQ